MTFWDQVLVRCGTDADAEQNLRNDFLALDAVYAS